MDDAVTRTNKVGPVRQFTNTETLFANHLRNLR